MCFLAVSATTYCAHYVASPFYSVLFCLYYSVLTLKVNKVVHSQSAARYSTKCTVAQCACQRATRWDLSRFLVIIIIIFFYPGTQFPGRKKIMLCKEKCQAGMVLTPPPPSQNCRGVE